MAQGLQSCLLGISILNSDLQQAVNRYGRHCSTNPGFGFELARQLIHHFVDGIGHPLEAKSSVALPSIACCDKLELDFECVYQQVHDVVGVGVGHAIDWPL